MRQIAKERGGRCLSDTYVNAHTLLFWECRHGHRWRATPNKVQQGRWCPVCASGLGERICRAFFEQLFRKRFPKVRPAWLVNHRGYRMELDGYCRSIGVAFEHQGRQHFSANSHYMTETKLPARQEDDKCKRDLCAQHGIVLIEVPEIVVQFPLNQHRRTKNMNKDERKNMRDGMQKTIKRLREAHVRRKNRWEPIRLHAVSFLCICCFIDALGKYIYGGEADRCTFKRFIEKYMPQFYEALVDKAVRERKAQREFYLDLFYTHGRCGLVHEYSPKRTTKGSLQIKSRGCNQVVSGTSGNLTVSLPELEKEFENILDKALRDVP